MLNTNFLEYAPWAGDLNMREFGSLVGFETGQSSTYALTRYSATCCSWSLKSSPFSSPFSNSAVQSHSCSGDSCSANPPSAHLMFRPTSSCGSIASGETQQGWNSSGCSIESRGKLFIGPGEEIYEGQIIGIHQRAGDLAVNACKRKAATNIRRCPLNRL